MMAAKPLYITVGLIIEEGFLITDLKRILSSMAKEAEKVPVKIIAGDTKVVEKGSCDKIFINTSGLGVIQKGINLSIKNASPGDCIILSGTIADHGVTILSERKSLKDSHFKPKSDCCSLYGLTKGLFRYAQHIRLMRDPTRGGLGSVLNEVAHSSRVGIEIYEEAIPIKDPIRAFCELLGIDPLYLANEGKFVLICERRYADKILRLIRSHRYGRNARIIGSVTDKHRGIVVLHTKIGGKRIVDLLVSEQLPRIC
jgi:hydrogenase expression/formation protein HypE